MMALRKAVTSGSRLLLSTAVVVLVVGPALPQWARATLFVGGGLLGFLLAAGVGEPMAVRVLFSARNLTEVEQAAVGSAAAELRRLVPSRPVIRLYVARQGGAPAAVARGRCSVIVAYEFIHLVAAGLVDERQVLAVVTPAAVVAQKGMSRRDPFIAFWSMPWCVLAALRRPLHGPLGLAWAARPLVFGVAITRCLLEGPPVSGMASAVVLALILALTYLYQRWAQRGKLCRVETADRELDKTPASQPVSYRQVRFSVPARCRCSDHV